jgi:hypothetical protein
MEYTIEMVLMITPIVAFCVWFAGCRKGPTPCVLSLASCADEAQFIFSLRQAQLVESLREICVQNLFSRLSCCREGSCLALLIYIFAKSFFLSCFITWATDGELKAFLLLHQPLDTH